MPKEHETLHNHESFDLVLKIVNKLVADGNYSAEERSKLTTQVQNELKAFVTGENSEAKVERIFNKLRPKDFEF